MLGEGEVAGSVPVVFSKTIFFSFSRKVVEQKFKVGLYTA